MKNLIKAISVASATALLVACGGGGGAGGNTGSSFQGVITGFGSVFVNGVEFETNGTSVSVDDQNGNEDDLKVGMLVTVNGSDHGDGTGQAYSIEYDDELEGLVISNSIAAGQDTGDMNIMGQTVSLTAQTIFESKVTGVTTPDQVAAGMVVEVSGYSSGMGSITATRMEVKAADLTTYLATHPEGIELKGVVANHDEVNQTFEIGSLEIDYSAAILDDMPNGNFDGLYVEVYSIQPLDNAGALVASKVELEDDGEKGHHGEEDDEMEIKGMITSSINGDTFELNGQVIKVNDQTEYEGISKSGLLVDVMVEVELEYINGEWIAEEVELEHESSQEIKGTVAVITTTGANTGTVELTTGEIFQINNDTIMEDSRDEGMVPDPKFNLEALMNGDYVEIYYYSDAGNMIATKLEREDF